MEENAKMKEEKEQMEINDKTYFELDEQGQRLPYLDAVAIEFIPDIQSEFMLFLQGKFDFINSLTRFAFLYFLKILKPEILSILKFEF